MRWALFIFYKLFFTLPVYAGANELAVHGVSWPAISSYKRISENARAGETETFTDLQFEGDGNHVRIEFIEPLEKEEYLEKAELRRHFFYLAHMTHRTPYAGAITYREDCSKKLKPFLEMMMMSGQKSDVLFGYASERFAIGLCSEGSARYRVALASLYDQKRKKMAGITVFVPQSKSAKKTASQPLKAFKFVK